jgi:hypothetical protein
MRRPRVLSQQSGSLKAEKPKANASKLIAVDSFSSRLCVLILNSSCRLAARAGLLLSSRASSTYKGS